MILFIPYAPASHLLKLVSVTIFSAVKFFFALPYAYAINLSYTEALITTCIGGLFGFFFFYHMSGIILKFLVKRGILKRNAMRKRKEGKKIFSRKNKLIVKTKLSYGLIGLVILTPIILSIPVGTFILRKYYKTNKLGIPLMCTAIILCSSITLSILYFL